MFAGAKRVPDVDAGGAPKRAHVDDAPAYDALETFRKEAIYRALREARRELERARHTIASLEEREAHLRGGIHAVNRFWDTLMEDVRVLHADAALSEPRHPLLVQAVHLAPSGADLVAGLDARADAARTVLAALAAHGGAPAAPDTAALEARCHTLAAEAATLRQALAAADAALAAARARAEQLGEDLRAAERRADRAASASVRYVEDPGAAAAAEAPPPEAPPAAEAAAAHPPQAAADTDALAAASEAHALADARLREADDLRAQLAEAQVAAAELRAQLAVVPDERVAAHPLFHEVQVQAVHAQHELERVQGECAALQTENDALREFRAEFQRQTATQANTHAEELQKQLRQRDADIVRLRGQRDELNAELLERRSRESVRFAQLDEFKALVGTKDERVETLRSQMKLIRLELAAVRGEAEVVDALAERGLEDGLEAALAQLRAENARLRAGAGPTDDALRAVGVSREQWESMSAEVERLRLQLRTSSSSTAALADEVDRLSAAYDALDRQSNARVISLSRLEDKILRLATEKSKADNKYFAAMRAKDALDAEKRALARSTERHNKVLERYADIERALGQQVSAAEHEVSALRRALQTHAGALADAERERAALRKRAAELHRARGAAEAGVAAHVRQAAEADGARQRADERAAALEREVGRLRRRLAEAPGTPGRRREETPLEYLNALLRCSACKERYRERVITRCMHTFCEPCVHARIQTRQRKCPHCGVPFAVSDVHTLYLQ